MEPTRVFVGPETLLSVTRIEAARPRWCGPVPAARSRVSVQVRAHGEPVPALLEVGDGGVRAVLDNALRGVAPGQALVAYDGTRVVGSATIERSSA